MIFEAKKIVSTTCQTRLSIFCLIYFGSRTRENKTEDNAVGIESLSHLVFFILHATFKNRKNRKPRKSALKVSIGISALGLSAHICPTCHYVRPCISLNTSNWPLKLYRQYIYGWFMGKFFFRFFGPYKAGPCLNKMVFQDCKIYYFFYLIQWDFSFLMSHERYAEKTFTEKSLPALRSHTHPGKTQKNPRSTQRHNSNKNFRADTVLLNSFILLVLCIYFSP